MRENRQMVEELEFVAGRLKHYEMLAREIDDHLRIVLAKEHTTVEGLKPGYYHVVRLRPGGPAWIKPYEGPNGEWRDLDEGIIDMIKERDLWNDRTQREINRKMRKAEQARIHHQQLAAQERAREFDERWHSANNLSVLITKDVH